MVRLVNVIADYQEAVLAFFVRGCNKLKSFHLY